MIKKRRRRKVLLYFQLGSRDYISGCAAASACPLTRTIKREREREEED